MTENELTGEILAAAIAVHRSLGPGLLESTYEICLARELALRGLSADRQKAVPLEYKGERLAEGYRIDLLVEGKVIVELKAVSKLEPVHESQLITYLKLTGCKVGLLINFNVPRLVDGVRRKVNGLSSAASASLR